MTQPTPFRRITARDYPPHTTVAAIATMLRSRGERLILTRAGAIAVRLH